MGFLPPAIPVEEIEERNGGAAVCGQCSEPLVGYAYFDDADDRFHCEKCTQESIDAIEIEAKAFAKSNCRITSALPEFDASKKKHKCTPEEYSAGNRESYTPNAYFCRCRHEYTNYDDLIRDLSHESTRDRILYDAIKGRIHFLLVDAIKLEQPAAVEDWFQDEWYFLEK